MRCSVERHGLHLRQHLLLRRLVELFDREDDLCIELVIKHESVREVARRLHLHGGLQQGTYQLAHVDLPSGIDGERFSTLRFQDLAQLNRYDDVLPGPSATDHILNSELEHAVDRVLVQGVDREVALLKIKSAHLVSLRQLKQGERDVVGLGSDARVRRRLTWRTLHLPLE